MYLVSFVTRIFLQKWNTTKIWQILFAILLKPLSYSTKLTKFMDFLLEFGKIGKKSELDQNKIKEIANS